MPPQTEALQTSARSPARTPAPPRRRRPDLFSRGEAWALVATALAVRAAVAYALATPEAAARLGPWEWGYEASSIADSLAHGRGFVDPFGRPSGPTAWLPPLYPLLVAACLRLGGGLAGSGPLLLYALQSLVSAATCFVIAGLGRAASIARAGRVAAWAWALYPPAVWNAIGLAWDTTLTAFVLSLIVLVLLEHGRGASPRRTFAFGLGIGGGLLVSATLLVLLPLAAVWTALGTPGPRARAIAVRAAALAAGALLVSLPWLARNAQAIGAATLRPNLGVELAAGNNAEANGWMQHDHHPSQSEAEFARYRELGEAAYCAEARDRASAWIRAHPARFAGLCARRVRLWWFGEDPIGDVRPHGAARARADWRNWMRWLPHAAAGTAALAGIFVLARRRLEGRLLLGLFALFPAPYYLTHFLERYRFPIEPIVVLLATWTLLEAYAALREQLSAVAPARSADASSS